MTKNVVVCSIRYHKLCVTEQLMYIMNISFLGKETNDFINVNCLFLMMMGKYVKRANKKLILFADAKFRIHNRNATLSFTLIYTLNI